MQWRDDRGREEGRKCVYTYHPGKGGRSLFGAKERMIEGGRGRDTIKSTRSPSPSSFDAMQASSPSLSQTAKSSPFSLTLHFLMVYYISEGEGGTQWQPDPRWQFWIAAEIEKKEEGGREGGGPIISCTIRRPASSLFPFLLFSIYISLN